MSEHSEKPARALSEHHTATATVWNSGNGVNNLDCETAALLRTLVMPLFQAASDWPKLQKVLANRGFGLAFRKGHMVLTDIATGKAICTGQFLGTPLADMAKRLGRPAIVALPGGRKGAFLN